MAWDRKSCKRQVTKLTFTFPSSSFAFEMASVFSFSLIKMHMACKRDGHYISFIALILRTVCSFVTLILKFLRRLPVYTKASVEPSLSTTALRSHYYNYSFRLRSRHDTLGPHNFYFDKLNGPNTLSSAVIQHGELLFHFLRYSDMNFFQSFSRATRPIEEEIFAIYHLRT